MHRMRFLLAAMPLVLLGSSAQDTPMTFFLTSAGPGNGADLGKISIAFSKDPEQTYIYLADGKNEKVYIIHRETMEILTSFGDGGRQPGQFFAVHSIATFSFWPSA